MGRKPNPPQPIQIAVYEHVDMYLGRVVDFMAEAQSFADKHGVDVKEVTLEFDYEMGYYNNPDLRTRFRLYRPETEVEYQKRYDQWLKSLEAGKKAAATAKENKEAHDLAEYERLKKKYG